MSKHITIGLLALIVAIWLPRELAIAEPYIAPYTPSIRQMIVVQAVSHAVDPVRMIRIATCESSMNPRAVNPKDVDGRPKYGLYQFDADTFKRYAPKADIETLDIWNAEQQIKTTAYMLSTDNDEWGCK